MLGHVWSQNISCISKATYVLRHHFCTAIFTIIWCTRAIWNIALNNRAPKGASLFILCSSHYKALRRHNLLIQRSIELKIEICSLPNHRKVSYAEERNWLVPIKKSSLLLKASPSREFSSSCLCQSLSWKFQNSSFCLHSIRYACRRCTANVNINVKCRFLWTCCMGS